MTYANFSGKAGRGGWSREVLTPYRRVTTLTFATAAISPKDRGESHHIKPITWIFSLTYEVKATQNIGFRGPGLSAAAQNINPV